MTASEEIPHETATSERVSLYTRIPVADWCWLVLNWVPNFADVLHWKWMYFRYLLGVLEGEGLLKHWELASLFCLNLLQDPYVKGFNRKKILFSLLKLISTKSHQESWVSSALKGFGPHWKQSPLCPRGTFLLVTLHSAQLNPCVSSSCIT